MRRLVSVLMPVYNAESYIAEAIESALGQTWQPVEVVVVDDGSTDASAAVAARFGPPVRLFRQAHAGIGAARNRAVAEAAGDYFALLDADDYWPRDKLEKQVAVLEADPGIDLVFGAVRQFVSPELPVSPGEREHIESLVQVGAHPGTLLARREAFARVGPFRTDFRVGEFVEWQGRANHLGLRSVVLPDVLLHRRIHRTNTVTRERAHSSDYLRIVKENLDRRRAAALRERGENRP